jgi:GNAT superfamily N-acetyltransferase
MWQMDEFMISTDRALLDLDIIHRFISAESYWGADRTREAMEKAMNNSAYCFGVYREKGGIREQIGFARVVSDLTAFGYIADVFILSEYRGKGLGKWLIETIVNHPELRTLKRITLFTRTPEFYRHAQFAIHDQQEQAKFMVRKMNS